MRRSTFTAWAYRNGSTPTPGKSPVAPSGSTGWRSATKPPTFANGTRTREDKSEQLTQHLLMSGIDGPVVYLRPFGDLILRLGASADGQEQAEQRDPADSRSRGLH